MHIFLDESGAFTNSIDQLNAPSCLGALSIPSRKLSKLSRKFNEWKLNTFGSINEVKGSKLDESQVNAVINLLSKNRVTLYIVIFDPAIHSRGSIAAHRLKFSNSIVTGMDGITDPLIRQRLLDLQNTILGLSDQLYAQAVATFDLVWDTIQNCLIDYWTTHPGELGNFIWRCDAKDINRTTEFEKMWQTLILPVFQDRSADEQLGIPDWNQTEHPFLRAYCGTKETAPKFLLYGKGRPPGASHYVKTGELLKDLRFEESKNSSGIQLADIATTAFRRYLRGKIKLEGVRRIGRLILKRSDRTIGFVLLEEMDNIEVLKRIISYKKEIMEIYRRARVCSIHRGRHGRKFR
jgi:hypothetical protein